MTAQLLALVLAAAAFTAAVLVLRLVEQVTTPTTTYRLSFGRDLTPEATTAFLAGLAGLAPSRWRRLWSAPAFTFEAVADGTSGIAHYLTVPTAHAEAVVGRLQAAGTVRLLPVPDHRPPVVQRGRELRLTTPERPLRTDQAAVASAAVLAALSPLRSGEAVTVQVIVSPGHPRPAVPLAALTRSRSDGLLDELDRLQRSEVTRRERSAKYAEAWLVAVVRVGVRAEGDRQRHLLRRVTAAFSAVAAPGVRLVERQFPDSLVADRLNRRALPLMQWPALVNASEAAGLVGWPIGAPLVPNLSLGGCRQLPVPPVVPAKGTVLAKSNFGGSGDRAIAIATEDRMKHLLVVGPTGSGKSTLLARLIDQDVRAGWGVVALALTGDVVASVVERIAVERVRDVVLLDAAEASERVVGFDPLAGATTEPDRAVDDVVYLLRQLHSDSWGPRLEDVLRSGLRTLTHRPGYGLLDLPRLLVDESWRQRFVATVTDPDLLDFWAWFESLSRGERATATSPVVNKLRPMQLHRGVRQIIGQAPPAGLDFDRVLAEGQVALVNLPSGALGMATAKLLAGLVVAQLWAAIRRRASLPPSQRRPVAVVLDEVSDLLALPVGLAETLAQARSLGVGVTLATQHPDQLPPDVRSAAMANARTKVCFQASAQAARFLAPDFGPDLTADDLRGLGPYEVAAAIAVGPTTAAVTTGTTLPLPPPTGQAEAVRAWSAEQFGRD
ncbi:MAG TPA: type IV secretion system DNA-binding domain-containing protein, partial [Acidimicrobiales bacterium]